MYRLFKEYLVIVLGPALYLFIYYIVPITTVFKNSFWGLITIACLIPQPNIWYKFHPYPFGKDCMDILIFAMLLGIMVQKKGFARTSNTGLVKVYIVCAYFALWNTSMRFSLPLPITRLNELVPDLKNYIEMIMLYFLALNIVKEEKQQRIMTVVMSAVVLLIGIRSYRNFSAGDVFDYDKRVGGPFEAVGLGSNHLGAFIAFTCALFLGLALFEKDRRRKILYNVTVLFGLHPLFFAYSRGAYLAALGTLSLFGLLKKRSLLALVAVILIAWQVILPPSVVNRITMTENKEGEVEHSAAVRLELWKFAVDTFMEHPVFGIGYGGYALSVGGLTLSTGEKVPAGFDTHNYWMKLLCEQGVLGFTLFLFLLGGAFRSGWRLYKIGNSDFQRGLGFGFLGCVAAIVITNMFGDRWSYFALGGYFWIFWGLVDRGILISQSAPVVEETGQSAPALQTS
jgi:O-antigen ligase